MASSERSFLVMGFMPSVTGRPLRYLDSVDESFLRVAPPAGNPARDAAQRGDCIEQRLEGRVQLAEAAIEALHGLRQGGQLLLHVDEDGHRSLDVGHPGVEL